MKKKLSSDSVKSEEDINALMNMAKSKKQNYYDKLIVWDNERI